MGAVLTLAACGGGNATEPVEQAEEKQEEVAQKTEAPKVDKDFDGTGMTETGACTFYLSTPGGTSEGGNVPQIAGGATVMQIGYRITDGDGTLCTIYVDGMENKKQNAGDTQGTLDLSGDALSNGIHTVELVADNNGEITIYKSGQYEVVS